MGAASGASGAGTVGSAFFPTCPRPWLLGGSFLPAAAWMAGGVLGAAHPLSPSRRHGAWKGRKPDAISIHIVIILSIIPINVIPICIIFVLELAAVIFLEMPPLHQLQGKCFISNPTEMSRISIDFHRDYARIFLGTYKYSPISPTGKGLDEHYEAEIPVKYTGTASIKVGEEYFSGEFDGETLSFEYVADASFFDDSNSSAIRQVIKLGNPFDYDSGITWVKNNWDVYFNTEERAERIVSPQHFEDEEEPLSSSSLIE